mgnify:FL=1
MKKKILYITLSIPLIGSAQTINTGDLSVSSGTEVSTYFDFKNESSGNVLNDGDFYFYGHYQNEGLFSYTTNSTTGYVVFEGLMGGLQNISGASPSSFYDVLFNKAGGEHAFHLTNDIENAGTVNLTNGVVWMDKENGGAFVFLKGAKHINTSDRSHVNGEVTKIGNETFKYPVGDGGYYRFAGISAPSHQADQYTGEYRLENSDALYPHASKSGVLEQIDTNEYWIIEQATPSDKHVTVTLSWDRRTTPASFVDYPDDLRVVRWDTEQELWVDEGGIVDIASQTVTTLSPVEGYGIFTLGKAKSHLIHPGDIVIYNGVTPNGDGLNDYFLIDNIHLYPRNTVRIFNRWGREVFYTENYDSSGNVFRGVAQGKGVINKDEQLPTGTYYYVLEYYVTEVGVERLIKKVGYLHLETE